MHKCAITQLVSQSGQDAVQRARGDDGGIELATYTIDLHKVPAEIRDCSIGACSMDESGSFIIECILW